MDVKHYSVDELITTNKQVIFGGIELAKAETAVAILPANTSFAIVAEVIERAEEESFAEVSTVLIAGGLLAAGAQAGVDNSLRDRFTGYFALVDTDFVVVKADKSEAVRTPISGVSVALEYGAYVLHAGGRKFRIERVTQIVGKIPFKSNAMGMNGGLSPIFKLLKANGAQIATSSAKSNATTYIFMFIIVAVVSVAVLYLTR